MYFSSGNTHLNAGGFYLVLYAYYALERIGLLRQTSFHFIKSDIITCWLPNLQDYKKYPTSKFRESEDHNTGILNAFLTKKDMTC